MFRSATLKNPPDWFREALLGGETDSGIRVDGRNAMTLSTWWQGVNVISGDVSTLPLDTYERSGERSRDKAMRHPAYRLMRRRPNPEMSASTFKKTLQSHVLNWGNGYARIIRNGRGEPDSLWIRRPDKTRAHRDSVGVYYESEIEVGDGRWETEVTDQRDMFHIKGLGWDGLQGYSVIRMARESIGLGLALEKYSNTFFKNNARPGGYIEASPGTTPDAARETLKLWNERHEGPKNQHKAGMLVNAKYHQLGIPNQDAQFFESRMLQRSEIAGWLGLPPHKVGDLENATFSNIEELNRNYLNTSLMHWLVTWEDECWSKLLTEQQRITDSHFFEFNTASLLRGTLAERYQAYSIGRQGEWLSPNDIRAFENMNPIDGGDDYTNPNVKSPNAPKPDSDTEDDATDVAADEQPADTSNVAHQLFVNSLRKLIRTECRRVKHHARNPKEFLLKVEEFYQDWEAKVLEAIAPAGDEDHAAAYCRESKSAILDASGNATVATLETVIDNLVVDWPQRAVDLAYTILNGEDDAT